MRFPALLRRRHTRRAALADRYLVQRSETDPTANVADEVVLRDEVRAIARLRKHLAPQ